MAKPSLKLVVLDNNGTMFDDLPVAYGSVLEIFRRHDLPPPTLQEYRNEIGADFMRFYRAHGFDALPHVTGADLNKIRKEYYYAHLDQAHYRGFLDLALNVMSKDFGLTLAVCSGEIQDVLDNCLNRAGLQGYFAQVVGQAWPKEPALVRLLVELRVLPEEAVYIDDTNDGIAAAKVIGMRTIGFTNPTAYCSAERIEAAGPTDTAANFTAVVNVIQKMLDS